MPMRAGKKLRKHEVPEEHLHQQRNIAKGFDIGPSGPGKKAIGQGAGNTDESADDKRDGPGAQRKAERPAEAACNPVEIASGSVGGWLEQQGHARPRLTQMHPQGAA
jgi:hypothetical protein